MPLKLTVLDAECRVPPLRSSGITTWEKCHRKHFFQDVVGLKSGFPSPALEIGTVFHRCLQDLYLGSTMGQAVESALARLSGAEQETAATYNSGLGFNLQQRLDDLSQATAVGTAMADIFWKYHPADKAKYQVLSFPGIGLMVEPLIHFEVARNLWSKVQLDLAIEVDNEVWIVDHKSSSISPLLRLQALTLGIQPALYWAGLTAAFKAKGITKPIVGVVHNVMQKPTIKYCPGTKDKGGIPGFIDRCREWYSDKHKDSESDPPLVQRWHRFDPNPLARHWKRISAYADGVFPVLYETADLLFEFPCSGDYACHEFNTPCNYLGFCGSDPALWKGIAAQRGYTFGFREDGTVPDLTITLDGTIIQP